MQVCRSLNLDALLPFASFVRSGKAAEILPTVEQVINRKPLTFATWHENMLQIFGSAR